MNPDKRPVLSAFSGICSCLALKHLKSLFLFHSKMNPTQVLFKPKVCLSLANIECHGNKEGAKPTALCHVPARCGSTWSRGMKSSCCRQSQPGFARREVNLEASSWQLRRILREREELLAALRGSQPAGSPGRLAKALEHSTPVLRIEQMLTSDCQPLLQGLSAVPGHPAGIFLTLLW